MRRPEDERQSHGPIVVPASDAFPYARAFGRGEASPLHVPGGYAATDFGLRPRRATEIPGSFPAQPSQRSACFAPRRASEYVRRIVAPFASPTSVPHMSQTRTVFRAMVFSLSSDSKALED
jgi:hypothetical protein